LPTLESLRLLYNEKKQLAKNAVTIAQKQNLPQVAEELFNLFPTLHLDFGHNISADLKSRAADDLKYERRLNEARKFYLDVVREALVNFKKTQNLQKKVDQLDIIFKARMNIRLTYRLENNKKQSIVETLRLKNFLLKTYQADKRVEFLKYYHDCVIQYARDIWTEGDRTLAFKTVVAAEKILKNNYSLAQVYWLKGRMEQEAQNLSKASGWFKLATQEQAPKPTQIDYEWTYAWNEYKLNHLENSIYEFQKLKNISHAAQDASTYFKTTYWLAKALESVGKTQEARTLYEENFDQNTFGYYGVLSKIDLIDKGEGGLSDFMYNLNPPNDLIHQKLNTGYWLWLLQENDLLARFVSYYWRTAGKGGKTVEIIESLLKLCEKADHLENGQRILIDIDNESRKKIFKDYSRWYFSTPYLAEVKKESKRFDVEYEFTYSIMRQESLFNEKARSSADAFGLLQLLPRIAELEAKKIGIKYSEPEDLFDPNIIIPIGVHHMSTK
jgi:soluble lytic murein transglycosylase